jgi:hypothetical protein
LKLINASCKSCPLKNDNIFNNLSQKIIMANAYHQVFEIITVAPSCKESGLYEDTQAVFLEEPDSDRPLRNGRFGSVIALGRGPSGDRPQPEGASGFVPADPESLLPRV